MARHSISTLTGRIVLHELAGRTRPALTVPGVILAQSKLDLVSIVSVRIAVRCALLCAEENGWAGQLSWGSGVELLPACPGTASCGEEWRRKLYCMSSTEHKDGFTGCQGPPSLFKIPNVNTPNSKQIPIFKQSNTTNRRHSPILERLPFDNWKLLGIWNLEFGTPSTRLILAHVLLTPLKEHATHKF